MIWELTEFVQEISVTNSSVVFQKKKLSFFVVSYFILLYSSFLSSKQFTASFLCGLGSDGNIFH